MNDLDLDPLLKRLHLAFARWNGRSRYLPSLNAEISGVDDRMAFEALVTRST